MFIITMQNPVLSSLTFSKNKDKIKKPQTSHPWHFPPLGSSKINKFENLTKEV